MTKRNKKPLNYYLAGSICIFAFALVAGCAQKTSVAARQFDDKAADAIWADAASKTKALRIGQQVYNEHCASCHGQDLKGASGAHVPNLVDDKWLYGGEDLNTFKMHPSDVEKTVLYGIRADHPNTKKYASMPKWQDPTSSTRFLTREEIDDVVSFVISISTKEPTDPDSVKRGYDLFGGEGTCFDCHSAEAMGDTSIGGTDLTTPSTWLYGTSRQDITNSIIEGRNGISPSFEGKLTSGEIKAVSIFVYSEAKAYDF